MEHAPLAEDIMPYKMVSVLQRVRIQNVVYMIKTKFVYAVTTMISTI